MKNKYYEKMNEMLKKDYKVIEKECEKILSNNTAYDVVTFINDYLYDLSDTVDNNYFLAISQLEEYYMSIYRKLEGLE